MAHFFTKNDDIMGWKKKLLPISGSCLLMPLEIHGPVPCPTSSEKARYFQGIRHVGRQSYTEITWQAEDLLAMPISVVSSAPWLAGSHGPLKFQ